MARKPRWKITLENHGILTIYLSGWKYFADFIHKEILDYRTYIFRGQRDQKWKLVPHIDRALRNVLPDARKNHLERFKMAVRGRRGPNPPVIAGENDWWALGQHHGLATPLLDWTTSPYAAAYFAFAEDSASGSSANRVVFGLDKAAVQNRCEGIARAHIAAKKPGRPSILEFVTPRSDENPRLVNQGGLFTRAPDGRSIERWVQKTFPKNAEYWILFKLLIPDEDRTFCLRSLNRMNINHSALFPDLFGASKYCNMDLEIDNY